MRIVFVCTGNTCRSSMAEALARKWLEKKAPDRTDVIFTSAGLAAFPGSPASSQAVEVMRESGIELKDHKATLFSSETVEKNDLILTVTKRHKQQILQSYPEAAGKVYTLAEMSGEDDKDILDPFGHTVDVYRNCALEIKILLDKALSRIFKV